MVMNRQQRRKMQREQARELKKKLRAERQVEFPGAHIFISCPDCHSKDIKETKKDHFKCNACGAKHPISEMDVEL